MGWVDKGDFLSSVYVVSLESGFRIQDSSMAVKGNNFAFISRIGFRGFW